VESCLFVVDAEGNVCSRFEGVVGGEEPWAAVKDVLTTEVTLG
jgi:hypothetical protein